MEFLKEFETLVDDTVQYIEQEAIFYPEIFIDNDAKGEQKFSIHRSSNLGENSSKFFLGVGSNNPDLLVVSDVSTLESDASPRSFDITSGKLFTKMLSAMNIKKDKVFITNLFKCGKNDFESCDCLKIFENQVDEFKPKVILSLGQLVSDILLKNENAKKECGGSGVRYSGINFVSTYHPRDLLKDQTLKRKAWENLQKVMEVLKK